MSSASFYTIQASQFWEESEDQGGGQERDGVGTMLIQAPSLFETPLYGFYRQNWFYPMLPSWA